jgi:NDP-sugar pyrophosphorylase family protein
MKAMILAAGVGSRLDPLTRILPKPLVPIVNRPVIEHIIDQLKTNGIGEIMVNLHYLGEVIQERLGDGSKYGVKLKYAQEDRLWGDAGSVKRSEKFFVDGSGDPFLVVGGDDISDKDLDKMIKAHREKGPCHNWPLTCRRSVRIRHRADERAQPNHPVPGKTQGRDHILKHGEYRHVRF